MAIAVLDLDIDRLPPFIDGLERYTAALILLRLHSVPVGQALLPVVAGRLGGDDLRLSLLATADSAFWEAWLRSYLGERPAPIDPARLPRATIAVCTRDRTEDLARCLEALMALPDDGQEVLVVDNAPATTATHDLVARYPRMRYVREDRPGLNNARNRALREAGGEIVAFTDDDAAPDPHWLRALLRNFDNPLVLCATGLTMALELETSAQITFQRYGALTRGFKRIVFDNAWHDPLLGWQAGAGANMALRRVVTDCVGPFDPALDAGTPTRAGGDGDMFRRILHAGYCIVYDPQALSWHRHRRSWEALRAQLFGYEVAGFGILTRTLVFEGDLSAIGHAKRWLGREWYQLYQALRRRPGSTPASIVLDRFRGAALGPVLYLKSYWQTRKG